jgi:hypothetical protein
MTSKISRESAFKLVCYIAKRGGGVSEDKLLNYIEQLGESHTEFLKYLFRLNYLTQIYENNGDECAEVIFVVTPEGREFLAGSIPLIHS